MKLTLPRGLRVLRIIAGNWLGLSGHRYLPTPVVVKAGDVKWLEIVGEGGGHATYAHADGNGWKLAVPFTIPATGAYWFWFKE